MRWILYPIAISGIIAIVIFLYGYPLIFPESYFSHIDRYGNFHIHADKKPDSSLTKVLKSVEERLSAFKPELLRRHHTVYLCYDNEHYARFADKANVSAYSQGMNLQPFDHIFISVSNINWVRQRYGSEFEHTLAEGSLAHIIVHEIVHTMIADRLGWIRSRRLPFWKAEGVAEYGASLLPKRTDTSYSFMNNLDKYFDGYYDRLNPVRFDYVTSSLLVEYLIDVRGLSIHEVLERDVSREKVLTEMENWYTSGDE